MKARALVLIFATIILLAIYAVLCAMDGWRPVDIVGMILNALLGLLIVGNRIHELRRIHGIAQLSPSDREREVSKLTPEQRQELHEFVKGHHG
jgi:hypothetical protein